MVRPLTGMKLAPAIVAALALSLGFARPGFAQEAELAPVDPVMNQGGAVETGLGCYESDKALLKMCQDYFRELEAWKARQATREQARTAPAPERRPEPPSITRTNANVSCDDPAARSHPDCQAWLEAMKAYDARAKAPPKPAPAAPTVLASPEGLEPADRLEEVGVGRATVRRLPDRGAPEVMTVRMGEQVHVVGVLATGWLQVAWEGAPIGWLHRSAIKPRQAAPVAPAPAPAAPLARPEFRGRNHALIIGNNDYANLPDLKTAVGDADALAEMLKIRYAFEPANVRLLLNADRRTILGELVALRRRLGPDDRLLLYYAGHGEVDPVTEAGYWQPVDAELDKDFTWIANDDIRRQLRGLPARHVLVVADSRFSGTLTRSRSTYPAVPQDRFFTEIDAHVSRKVISSGGTEPVADQGSGGHSVFSYFLLKTLRENREPYLASFELFNRFVRAVTNNSRQKPQFGTVSDAGDEGAGDFTFILAGDG
jgi:hypothetical protein